MLASVEHECQVHKTQQRIQVHHCEHDHDKVKYHPQPLPKGQLRQEQDKSSYSLLELCFQRVENTQYYLPNPQDHPKYSHSLHIPIFARYFFFPRIFRRKLFVLQSKLRSKSVCFFEKSMVHISST